MRPIHNSWAKQWFRFAITAVALLLPVFQASAIIDAALQMQLGNPTGATIDTNNHSHYLIQRTVEALDYNDNLGVPNWTSWDLTSSDYVVNGPRSSSFYIDTSLPPSFHQVASSEYNSAGWVRGHMCPSADRTDNVTDNNLVFLMSNILPQNSSMNSGVWGAFEAYCRTLLSTNELLITSGPRGFGADTIPSGYVRIPSNLWKIAVCAPLGAGTALSRITNANPASIRVIAIDIPNAAQGNPWSNFVVSVKQLQYDTGYTFFSALPNNLAWVLRSKIDGQTSAAPTIVSFFPASGSQSNSVTINGAILDTITNVVFNGTPASYTITATNQIIASIPVGASSGQITVRGLGGSATSVSSFTVTPPVLPNFTVTPGSAFASSGGQGGPFSPSIQIYTLNNTNVTSLSWAADKNVSWLDLSASSGTLPAGASTNITVSVNGTANTLASGAYAAAITFSNSATQGWTARGVNLTVLTLGQLAVSPVNTYGVMEQAGGPFTPTSRDYTLANTGSISLNWTVNATASWLNLSAASGTLPPGSSTVMTVTINSSSITLPPGIYNDTISFTNMTSSIGSTMRDIELNVVSFGFYDDFSTFSSGNLIGQANWQEQSTTNVLWMFEGDNINAYDGNIITTVGNIAADTGSGVATGMHANAISKWTAAAGNGSLHSWNVDHWSTNDFFQYQVSTLGVAGIQLSWDQTSSGSGPRDFQLQWSTNGSVFTAINAYTVQANVSNQFRTFWNASVYEPADHYNRDLSSITAIENQPAVYFRFICKSTTNANGTAGLGATGSDRMDNFLVGRAAVTPIQISGGKTWVPGGQTAIKPDAWKDFNPTTNITVFAGMAVNVTNAPVVNSGTPSFFATLASANGGIGGESVANYQVTAKAADAANTNYVLGARTTGETNAPFVYGTTSLSYGTIYRVIIQTDPAGTNTIVYVNPTSDVLGAQTPYLTAVGGAGITPATALASFVVTQSKNGSLPTVGAGIGRLCAASDFASVYHFLDGDNPAVASFIGSPTSGVEPLNVTFTDTSTGTITNRFWDFGDSSTTNVTTNVVSHTYAAGTYNVSLVVNGTVSVNILTQPNYIMVLTAFQSWQLFYFGSTTDPMAAANADPDGDGQSNMAEFLAGTDPTNSSSALRITSVVRQGNDILIGWTTPSGRTNALQFAVGGSYTNNFSDLFIVTNAVGAVTNYLHGGAVTNIPARYYRIRLVP